MAASAGTTTIGGRRIGWSAAGDGAPTVLIHGFGADRQVWIQTVPALSAVSRVVSFDLPGHGTSDVDVGDGSVPFLADVVRGFLDAHDLSRLHVVAHSLGAAIALHIAAAEPGRFAGLSLIAPAGLSDTISRDFTDGFVTMRDEDAARQTLSLLVARPSSIGRQMVRDTLAFAIRPGNAEALARIAEANFPAGRQRYRYEDTLAAFPTPWTLIWGSADKVLPPPSPNNPVLGPRLTLIPAAGHMPHLEQPAAVNRLLLAAITGDAPARTEGAAS